MNAVGIDVSKGKSMVAVMRPFGEVVATPYEVCHTECDLKKLAAYLKELPGETRVVMEYTGKYYQPIAKILHEEGVFVSVVNALLVYKCGNNSIRRCKTDKLDRRGAYPREDLLDSERHFFKSCLLFYSTRPQRSRYINFLTGNVERVSITMFT